MPTIYGIKNCDTMKKARAWLDEHGVAYGFHDYKTAGIDKRQAGRLGARRSAGRRCSTAPARPSASCPTSDKEGLTEEKAIALMLAQPSMIKRPVLDVAAASCWSASSRSSTRSSFVTRLEHDPEKWKPVFG